MQYGVGRLQPSNRLGALFLGTENAVYVSFDDGGKWQPLRQNMGVTSVRDIIVKDDDLVAGTHGRGFWILDDITPLRQIGAATESEDVVLFEPTVAWRVRWNTSTDMPWPVEEPTGPNPPDGAIINYYLRQPASGPVSLEIEDAQGRMVRRYSSSDTVAPIPQPANAPVPLYWYRAPQTLSAAAGMHRFVWDVHYQPIADSIGAGGGRGGLPITAIPHNSAPAPGTPWVPSGTYRVKLTANGKTVSQSITVKQDPRVKTPALTMQQVYAATSALYFGAVDAQAAIVKATAWRDQIGTVRGSASGDAAAALTAFERKLEAVVGAPAAGAGGRGGRGGGGGAPQAAAATPSAETVQSVRTQLGGLMNSMQAADVAPPANTLNAVAAARAAALRVMGKWKALETIDLPEVNARLRAAGVATFK